jgi:anti-sigma regulatory factor (Ser/Thr protein kinase)
VATVELSFSPLTSHVRTARIVAASLARQLGLDEETVDEVRLAVGEACARAVAIHAALGLDAPVVLRIDDGPHTLAVDVCDRGEVGAPEPQPGLGLAVVTGLVDDVVVERGPNGNHVRMVWPVVTVVAATRDELATHLA